MLKKANVDWNARKLVKLVQKGAIKYENILGSWR